jgi:hypothetical protein
MNYDSLSKEEKTILGTDAMQAFLEQFDKDDITKNFIIVIFELLMGQK